MKLTDLLKNPRLRAVFTSLNTALTPDIVEQFTAEQKADVEALREALGSAGTAGDASGDNTVVSLNALTPTFESMTRMVVAAQGRATDLAQKLAAQETSLNRLKALEDQVTAGDLIPKSAHETALAAATKTARDEAITSERTRAQKLGERRAEWSRCNLPTPPDEVLEAETEPAVRAEALKRVETLRTCGLAPGDVASEVLWAPEATWKLVSVAIDKVRGKGGGGNPLAAGAKPDSAKVAA